MTDDALVKIGELADGVSLYGALANPARPSLEGRQYVIRNDGTLPMVINYRQNDASTSMVLARHATSNGSSRYGMVHISNILLPGEELTITAIAVKVP